MSFFGDDQQERKTRGSASFGTSQLGLSSATNPDGSTYFTRGSGGELLSRRTPQGRQYYLTDSLGSVVGLTRQDGSVSNRYRYDPFGNTMNQGTEEPDPQPFKFGGEFYDSDIKIYKQGLRFYDPELGRWTQRDPLDQVTEATQANRYGFAGQDPVNLVDPSGAHGVGGFLSEVLDAGAEAMHSPKVLTYSARASGILTLVNLQYEANQYVEANYPIYSCTLGPQSMSFLSDGC